MKKTRIVCAVLSAFLCLSCKTTKDMEKDLNEEDFAETGAKSVEEEEAQNEQEMKGYFVEEELKVQDVESTVVYVDRPVYVPEPKENDGMERPDKSGYDAAKDSQKRSVRKPENYKDGTFFYQYNEHLIYEVYAQPYHLTDIMLEPGETVKGRPLLSEDDSVWELTAGVSVDPVTNEDVQHFFIKPAYSKLDSSFIVITDRRVYHFRIKSFADTYMSMVKFSYPEKANRWAKSREQKERERTADSDFIRVSNPEFLSFDYKIKYSMWRKPEFLPKRVYDDGQATYVQVDDIVLQKKLPVLFNEKNEIENYSVKKNVFVIPRLINKMTLRLGKQKVIIEKKKTSERKLEKEQKEQAAASEGK